MTDYTLTVLDTAGIQNYIFGSNRLKENIGASELVAQATNLWPFEALRQLGQTNIKGGHLEGNLNDLDDDLHIEDPKRQLIAEVVYAGGGNTVILFRDMETAHAFAYNLTRRVLMEAPGLELVLTHQAFDWKESRLKKLIPDVITGKLQAKKQVRPAPLPMLGLGVTAACVSTGLPAVDVHQEKEEADRRLISGEIKAKLEYFGPADERLKRKFGIRQYPHDLEHLVRNPERESYIAVVHADGNEMGQRVRKIRQRKETADNRVYIQRMRAFSRHIESATQQALQAITQQIEQAQLYNPGGWFPFRPIIFGGDDVTFVCDGPMGIRLAVEYLKQFEKATGRSKELGTVIHACAGIAIIKSHYPFARAYVLAEELCGNSKRQVRAAGQDFSALDWQFAISGITGELDEIREREYHVRLTGEQGEHALGYLYQRPLRLRPAQTGEQADKWLAWRSWGTFESILRELTEADGDWRERRNKVKALRGALRKGPKAVQAFLAAYDLKRKGLPAKDHLKQIAMTGWDRATAWDQKINQCAYRCAYFDAIEAMDHIEWLAG